MTIQDSNENAIVGGRAGVWIPNKQTSDSGGHNHTVAIGGHSHTVDG